MSALPCSAPVGYSPRDNALIRRALKLIEQKHLDKGACLNSPNVVRDYLRLRFAGLEREELHALYLDSGLRLIAAEVASVGTYETTTIYPRDLLIAAARHGAVNVIIAHNHPGGSPDPSEADLILTRRVESVLATAEFKLLDHFVITATSATSIREHTAALQTLERHTPKAFRSRPRHQHEAA